LAQFSERSRSRTFHLATWGFVAVGSALPFAAWRRGSVALPWRRHAGLLLAGWGAFNLVEGLIDHQLLGLHHVRDDLGGPIGWDLAFLALGTGLAITGWWLVTSGRETVGRSVPGPRV
jgi:uncharacterized membrane protein